MYIVAIIFLCLPTALSCSLTDQERTFYEELSAGITNEFTEEMFEKILRTSPIKTDLEYFLPYVAHSALLPKGADYSQPLEKQQGNALWLVIWSLEWFGTNATNETAIVRAYKKASVALHPDKIGPRITRIKEFISDNGFDVEDKKDAEKIREALLNNIKKLDELMKQVGGAKQILTQFAENRDSYRDVSKIVDGMQEKKDIPHETVLGLLEDILSTEPSGLLYSSSDEKKAIYESLKKQLQLVAHLMSEKADNYGKIAIKIITEDSDPEKDLDLYKQITPKIQQRSAAYTKNRSTNPFHESLKNKNVDTLVDIAEYATFLNKPQKITAEMATLGKQVDDALSEMLNKSLKDILLLDYYDAKKLTDYTKSELGFYWWLPFSSLKNKITEIYRSADIAIDPKSISVDDATTVIKDVIQRFKEIGEKEKNLSRKAAEKIEKIESFAQKAGKQVYDPKEILSENLKRVIFIPAENTSEAKNLQPQILKKIHFLIESNTTDSTIKKILEILKLQIENPLSEDLKIMYWDVAAIIKKRFLEIKKEKHNGLFAIPLKNFTIDALIDLVSLNAYIQYREKENDTSSQELLELGKIIYDFLAKSLAEHITKDANGPQEKYGYKNLFLNENKITIIYSLKPTYDTITRSSYVWIRALQDPGWVKNYFSDFMDDKKVGSILELIQIVSGLPQNAYTKKSLAEIRKSFNEVLAKDKVSINEFMRKGSDSGKLQKVLKSSRTVGAISAAIETNSPDKAKILNVLTRLQKDMGAKNQTDKFIQIIDSLIIDKSEKERLISASNKDLAGNLADLLTDLANAFFALNYKLNQ